MEKNNIYSRLKCQKKKMHEWFHIFVEIREKIKGAGKQGNSQNDLLNLTHFNKKSIFKFWWNSIEDFLINVHVCFIIWLKMLNCHFKVRNRVFKLWKNAIITSSVPNSSLKFSNKSHEVIREKLADEYHM